MKAGIMIHELHGEKWPEVQGSISVDKLKYIIETEKHRLKNPCEWINSKEGLVLTFDDNLRCQYDLAQPVLDEYGLKAFWFINTRTLYMPDNLSRYKYFRATFKDIDDFYEIFFKRVGACIVPYGYLPQKFYSDNDRKFRYIRDEVLTSKEYINIMDTIIDGYDSTDMLTDLWMDEAQIVQLVNDGHVIGSHSNSHPTNIDKQHIEEVHNEYLYSKEVLERLLDKDVFCMSHPCGKYRADILLKLESLGYTLGFGAFMPGKGKLAYGRVDSADYNFYG